MRSPRLTRLVAAFLATVFLPVSIRAGPCAADIDRVQAKADAQIEATAGRGRMGTESTAATDHREPTPESIARVEQRAERPAPRLERVDQADAFHALLDARHPSPRETEGEKAI